MPTNPPAPGALATMPPLDAAAASAAPTARVSAHNLATRLDPGATLFEHADRLGCRIPSSCGRTGTCHECIVEIKQGESALNAPTVHEAFLRGRYRLACQCVVESAGGDIEFATLRRTPRILTGHHGLNCPLEPAVTRRADGIYHLDTRIDHDRGNVLGLALDLGTTTVAFELVDLVSGDLRYAGSFENPQRFGGSDVMHRISYDGGPWRGELHKAIITTLNTELRAMGASLGIRRQMIYELVVAGNATMRDLFFGLDVQPIGQKPYKSHTETAWRAGERDSTELNVAASELKLWMHPRGRVIGLPLVASHIGGDTVGGLLAINAADHSELFMLVDVGTNTEVVVGNRDRMVAASCPAGPAFEGGHVKFGMPGCSGAIERVRLRPDHTFETHTIEDKPAQGICGSGLIDLLAELRRANLMTPKGVFANRARELMIDPTQGITFSREDASVLAQAKAANTCGEYIVMRHCGIEPDQITKLYLAGGFANYIDVEHAIAIGFLPPIDPARVIKIGNAALNGARAWLLSLQQRVLARELLGRIEHIELETTPDFFEIFVEACQFKPMPALRADLRIREAASA